LTYSLEKSLLEVSHPLLVKVPPLLLLLFNFYYSETIQRYFEQFGELCDCVLMQDKATGINIEIVGLLLTLKKENQEDLDLLLIEIQKLLIKF